jgi:hypothetical protein
VGRLRTAFDCLLFSSSNVLCACVCVHVLQATSVGTNGAVTFNVTFFHDSACTVHDDVSFYENAADFTSKHQAALNIPPDVSPAPNGPIYHNCADADCAVWNVVLASTQCFALRTDDYYVSYSYTNEFPNPATYEMAHFYYASEQACFDDNLMNTNAMAYAEVYPAYSCLRHSSLSSSVASTESTMVTGCSKHYHTEAAYEDSRCNLFVSNSSTSSLQSTEYKQPHFVCSVGSYGYVRTDCNFMGHVRTRKTPRNVLFSVLIILIVCPVIFYVLVKIFAKDNGSKLPASDDEVAEVEMDNQA